MTALDFAERLGAPLKPASIEVFQINLGKLCNMSCEHCHVDAGPDKTAENMDRGGVDACLAALDRVGAKVVDLTGGAPELNPHFRYLVDQCVARGKKVIDRCNLSVLLLPRCADLPGWLAERKVEVCCSLPHHRRRNTDLQRGAGAFDASIEGLRRLNAAGYGKGYPERVLTLVSNPAGAFLAGDQRELETEWKRSLKDEHGVSFDRLIVLNNMPIARFLSWLERSGNLDGYLKLLSDAYNPATVPGLMCRNTISVSWDGRVFDCDFNQMLGLDARDAAGRPITVQSLGLDAQDRTVITGRHCFGCTAGAGSSCGGSLA